MNKKANLATFAASSAALAVIVAMGCGGSGSRVTTTGGNGGGNNGGPTPRHYLGAQSSAGAWDVATGPADFSAQNRALGTGYGGSLTTLPSGFQKWVVSRSSDSTVTVGMTTYALELPNATVIVKSPSGTGFGPIIGAGTNPCPTGARYAYNYMEVPNPDTNYARDGFFGRYTFEPTAPGINAQIDTWTLGGTSVGSGQEQLGCTTGEWTATRTLGMWNPNGIFVVGSTGNIAATVGLVKPPSEFEPKDITQRIYRGFWMTPAGMTPVSVTTNGPANQMLMQAYSSDAELQTDTPDKAAGAAITITLGNQPFEGFLYATCLSGDGRVNQPIAMMAGDVNGKRMIIGSGGTGQQQYGLYLIEK